MKPLATVLLFVASCVTASAQISSFSPPYAVAGGATFNLALNGNFSTMAQPLVTWSNLGAADLTVISYNSTQIVVTVPANLIANAGTANIRVAQPNAAIYTASYVVRERTPTIGSIAPTSVNAGSPAFQLTVNGTNYLDPDCNALPCSSLSTVYWNGIRLTTLFFSTTRLSANVPANLLLSPTTAPITVVNPDGGTSNAVDFTVTYPVPTLTAISPGSAVAGSSSFTLTASGAGFFAGSIIEFDGNTLPTTLPAGATGILTATVPASLVLTPRSVPVRVRNPGALNSSALTFNVTFPVPVITGIAPASINAGASGFTLTVTGTGLYSGVSFPGSVVLWNGSPLPPLPVSDTGTLIQAFVAPALVAQAGTANVTVVNPGQRESNAARFTIVGRPTLISVSPSSAAIGDLGVNLTLSGTFFQANSVALFNGQPLSTTFLSATQLTAVLPPSLIATAGNSLVSVTTPGQLTTAALPFNVSAQPLSLTSLSPSTIVEGSPAFSIVVNGAGFTTQTALLWNGLQPLAITSFSESQLTATVPAALVVKVSTAVINASNPNQPLSNGLSFLITATPISLTSVSPASAVAGSPATTITITGTGFLPGVTATWNALGPALSSTYVSATQFTAVIPAALLANAGPASIRANNPSGPFSNSVPFAITAPTITLTGITPNTATAGGPAFTLNATGTGFQSGSQIVFNGTALATAFISATQLSAVVPPNLTSAAGAASIAASNPAPNAATSNALTFTLTAPVTPSLTSITPNSATAGDTALTLTASGTGFTGTSVLQFNGTALATAFVSATQLTASLPSSLLAAEGTASVTVSNGRPQTSNSLPFTINPRINAPAITSLNPATVTAGSGAFTLTVNGANFTRDAGVFANTTSVATTFVSATQLTAVMPANLLAQPGSLSITATSNGATSNAVTLTIALPPAPAVTLTGPASIGPAQQPPITFNLGTPYPLPLAGTVTLTFVPNAAIPSDDPAIQFASGGRTLNFTLAANSLALPGLQLQTGTVAGAVTLTMKLTTGAIDVTPAGSTLTLQIPRQAPVLRAVQLVRNATGLDVNVTGFATSREVTQATFHFNIAAGSNLQVADFTVPLTGTFATWYGSAAAAPFGSQFTYTQPFTAQGGSTAITSVTVTLSNAVGVSQPVTSN